MFFIDAEVCGDNNNVRLVVTHKEGYIVDISEFAYSSTMIEEAFHQFTDEYQGLSVANDDGNNELSPSEILELRYLNKEVNAA